MADLMVGADGEHSPSPEFGIALTLEHIAHPDGSFPHMELIGRGIVRGFGRVGLNCRVRFNQTLAPIRFDTQAVAASDSSKDLTAAASSSLMSKTVVNFVSWSTS